MKENRTGKKFKSLREDAKYSQEKLARLLNCQPEQVVQWENGEEEPSLDQCMLMCRLYGMTADEMFSHINSDYLIDNSIKDEFLYESSVNRILKRRQYL